MLDQLLQRIYKLQTALFSVRLDHWINHELFRFQWWFMLISVLASWFLWWKFVDKKRIVELFAYGMSLSCLIVCLDSTGTELGLWAYPYKLIPFFNRLFFTVDMGMLPVIYMLMYQHFRKWRPFIVAHVFLAIILAFIMEPIAVWLNIYVMVKWSYLSSFPIYIIIPVIVRLLFERVLLQRQK